MSMTRKTYNRLAADLASDLKRLIHNPTDSHAQGARVLTFWSTVGTFCDYLAIDNPRFDRKRFITAIEEGAMK